MKVVGLTKASLVASLILAGASAMACQGVDEFDGVKEADAASRGELVCLHNAQPMPAKINVYARYRCMNSPVYGVFKIGDLSMTITKVSQISEKSFTVQVKESGEAIVCQLK